jgi:ABC-type Fe3+-hydroxamate transport system substrate-binding protein
MRPGVALLLASWALVAPACGFKPEPIGALPEFPQEVTDGLGRHLTVEAQPQRIASLDAGLTESAFAIGAGPLVVAASGQERYPAAARELPALVTENGEVRLESLVAAQPDVVLAPPARRCTSRSRPPGRRSPGCAGHRPRGRSRPCATTASR